MKKHISHGEFNLFEINAIPEGAKRIYPSKDCLAKNGFIVAPSESTGNHHCVLLNETIEFYENDGVLYIKNNEPTELFCIDEKRHDTVVMPSGIWKGKSAKEVDHLLKIKRNVID